MRGIFWIIVAICAAVASKFLSPLNAMDTGWDFGHAYSMFRDSNSLFYNDYLHQAPDYLYGLVLSPFVAFSTSTYVPKVFYSIVLISFGLLLYRRKNSNLSIGIIALVLSNYLFLTHRPEIFTILIGFFSYPYLFIQNKIKWNYAIPLGLILFFIHPPNAILLAAALLASKNLLVKNNKTYLSIYLLVATILLYTLLGPNNFHHFAILKSRILDGNPLIDFIQFLKYGGLTLFALFVAKRRIWTPTFILNYTILFCLCLLLGPYYYYTFLIVPFLLIAPITQDNFTKTSIGLALIFNVITVLVHPYITFFEHPEYSSQATRIIEYIDENAIKESQNVFIDQHISFPFYAKSSKAKMIMSVGHSNYFLSKKPEDGDVAYFTDKEDALLFEKELKHLDTTYFLKTQKIISSTKGKLTLQSLYRKRTDSLGLYRMSILKNEI